MNTILKEGGWRLTSKKILRERLRGRNNSSAAALAPVDGVRADDVSSQSANASPDTTTAHIRLRGRQQYPLQSRNSGYVKHLPARQLEIE